MTSPTIYRNVESVLNILNTHKVENIQAVNSLLQIYNNVLKLYKEDEVSNPTTTKHPLIILEGLDGCGKSTVCKVLASKFNAAHWCTPPESIKHIRHLFDDHPQLRTAYYVLGNYIAALECSPILKKQPVVMDRYWHSTAAYTMAQAVHDFPGKIEIPPEGDSFYTWPEDLLKPSAVVFLTVNETNRLERISRRSVTTTQENLLKNSQKFRDNITLLYKNMIDPEVIFVDSNTTVGNVVKELEGKLKHLFI